MTPARLLGTALEGLRRNSLRAALTALGIIIGIAAVIVMIEIGQGSSTAIRNTIASMGANTLIVQPGAAASGGVSYGGGSASTLTPDDAEAILRECPAVESVAPIVRVRTQIVYGNKNWIPLSIYGTTPSYLTARDWQGLAFGEMFGEREVRMASQVCVIGETIRRELFGSVSPLGQDVRIRNVPCRVVGVLRQKGANMMGMDQDDTLLAPWTTVKFRMSGSTVQGIDQAAGSSSSESQSTYPRTTAAEYPGTTNDQRSPRFMKVDQILVAARSAADIRPGIDQITALLRERHRIREGEAEDFNIRNMAEMTEALTSTTRVMTRLLLCVALISLVVGGVGIMNIMLVSVTERTREIGLRMAVGARARDILWQFLAEATMLCLAGGVAGIILGRGVSALVTFALKWPTEPSVAAVIAAVVVATGTGIIFGYYPARKAAKMDPIEALRYE